MNTLKRTMQHLSYGMQHPLDLLSKLKLDAEKLTRTPHPYEVFNFVVTAAVLAEWIQKFYVSESAPEPFASPNKKRNTWLIPRISPQWIKNRDCIPNREGNVERDIANALSICAHTANATKHFHWNDQGAVSAIGETPPIGDWYQYFFTSTAPDLYVCIYGENYGLQQVKDILLQFYAGLIEYLDEIEGQSSPT